MLSYSQIATALDGRLIGEDKLLQSVSIDSRTIKQGDLYVALRGANFDGHDFLPDVVEEGADGVMVERQSSLTTTQILVEDTRLSLGRLAKLWREQFTPALIAITGSNGKTTVKEMLASILQQQGLALVTKGNLNNEIGVPLTLLRLDKTHRYAVIEMGANHPGEIRYLSQLAEPQTALITNAGPAHLEGFGSVEGVARAKAEIYEHVQSGGTAIINADDPFAPLWREAAKRCRRIEFGLDNVEADIKGQWQADCNRLTINTSNDSCVVELPLPGVHSARNALAAAAAAISVGIGMNDIKQGLEMMRPVKGRLFPLQGICNMRILDDTYNANPASVKAALDVITAMDGEAWLILGDMGELGVDADKRHAQIGELANSSGIQRLFTLGELSTNAARCFGRNAASFTTVDDLVKAVIEYSKAGVNILVKGSRAMHMEQVVAKLTDLDSASGDQQSGRGNK